MRGVTQRYAFLTAPRQPGFFVAWLGYATFVAATLRWLIDIFLLAFFLWRSCQTPSIPRLESEATWIPAFMLLGVIMMTFALWSKQTVYLRVVPMWIAETFVTLLPIALVLALIGLAFFWVDLRFACK